MLGAVRERFGDPGVHAPGKPAIRVQPDEYHAGMLPGHGIGASVARVVVDDDDLEARVGRRGERAEARERVLAPVPRQHDGRHRRSHASSRR